MKIILLKNVKNQGKKDDLIEVKDGYGNFLIKNKDAVLATQFSVERLNRENEENELSEVLLTKEMEALKIKLEKETLIFKVKVGNNDRVFGSVSTKQIANELKNKGYDIDKKKISLKEPIISLGFHKVTILLHKKVTATLNVKIEESK